MPGPRVVVDEMSRLDGRLVLRVVIGVSIPLLFIMLVTVCRIQLGRHHAGEKFDILAQQKLVILLLDPTGRIANLLATKVPEKLAMVDDFASNHETWRRDTLVVLSLSVDMLGEKEGCRTHLGEFVITTQFPTSDARVKHSLTEGSSQYEGTVRIYMLHALLTLQSRRYTITISCSSG